ncbi:energy-coupling factor transporter transmembrane protein EcfT [Paenibacillus alba]|uniref:energy-coupling factor transporter transmembrane component T family protein n=1 Tax=Paenibacillus alba TaxID=1197127 RepID=UPI0015634BDB|nr:energy-coupling factor transporter transmembrane component T [Paenibacillus alba]NQX68842.1 energy-coupling factor transporter transmembrane protein EcfT [Paenibacillus alba]
MSTSGYLIYEKRNSWIEQWDPRIKIAAFSLFGLSLLIHHSPVLKTAQILILVMLWSAAKLRWSTFGWTLLSLSFFFLTTMIFHAVLNLNPGDEVIHWWWLSFTHEGIVSGILMCEQIAGVVIVLSLLVRTTSPIELAEGMEKLCEPLKKWKIPVHDAVTMFSIALRFVPLLFEEFDTIRKAQTARGGGFHRKGALARFGGVIPMLIPLFVLSIQRAKDLAIAMESRGYRGDIGRTAIREYTIGKSDIAVLIVSIAICIYGAII